MSAFVIFGFVSQYRGNCIASKNGVEGTYFCVK